MMLFKLILIFKCHRSWRAIDSDISDWLTASSMSHLHPSLHSGAFMIHEMSPSKGDSKCLKVQVHALKQQY